MSYEAMSYDVLKVMDNMKIEKACLMGHSMGGKAFMTTALLHVMHTSFIFISIIFLLLVLSNINVSEAMQMYVQFICALNRTIMYLSFTTCICNKGYIVIPKHLMEYFGTICMLLNFEIEILSDKLLKFSSSQRGFQA